VRATTRHPFRIRVRGRKISAAFIVAWQMFAHGAATAQPPGADGINKARARHRVLIITDDPNDPFMTRVQAELSALPDVEITTKRPAGSLDADARTEQADAAVRKVASGKGVEVWMADATSGRSLLRQLVIDESPGGPDQGLVALQTAELLRTGLRARQTAVPTLPAPSPPPSTATEDPSRDHAMLVGVGPLWSQGGVGPSLQVWFSYQHLWSGHLGLSLDASAPLRSGSISSAEGTAHVGTITAGAGLLARLHNEKAKVTGTATLGLAFAAVLTDGDAHASYLGSTTTAYTGLAYLRLGVAWHPVPWLALGAAGLVGTTTNRERIEFANRGVGHWGAPLFAAFPYGEFTW
jgi:hypothetical protein